MATVSAPATRPFDFGESLAFLAGFAPCADDVVLAGRRLVVGGFVPEPFVARVAAADGTRPDDATGGSADAGALAVDVEWLDESGDEGTVVDRLRGHLSLDDDLRPLYAAAADDPPFARVVGGLHGYHHVRFPTPFEAACWAALSRRSPLPTARELKRDLVEACGRIASVDGGSIQLFPTPRMVLSDAEDVRTALGNERTSGTILSAAERFVSADLAALDDEDLVAALVDVPGFDDWAAEFVAIRGFGRMRLLPRADDRLRIAVADLYDLGRGAASDEDLRHLSDRYGSQRGYWAHYVRVWTSRRRGE
ncbi:DNA-3-methyladenine glycosylase family protein [Halegenticoccus tardaugens]|uniref:DNA-3-methyladenine glycosylase family protein n=1 Tax=Halegenticoccus tardaugens TaxID=2071624 RepID=UPI00100A2928|nr:DNA-3-methyladenine glycosylase 2 family protein [Halegenticoccus tardaugens]